MKFLGRLCFTVAAAAVQFSHGAAAEVRAVAAGVGRTIPSLGFIHFLLLGLNNTYLFPVTDARNINVFVEITPPCSVATSPTSHVTRRSFGLSASYRDGA